LYSERTRQRRVVGSGLAFEALRGDSPSHTHSGESKRLHNMEHLLPLRFSEIGNECGGDGHHRGRRGTRDKPGRVYSSDGIYSSGFIRQRFIRQTGLDRRCVTTNQDGQIRQIRTTTNQDQTKVTLKQRQMCERGIGACYGSNPAWAAFPLWSATDHDYAEQSRRKRPPNPKNTPRRKPGALRAHTLAISRTGFPATQRSTRPRLRLSAKKGV
jgi:hypothetical protein